MQYSQNIRFGFLWLLVISMKVLAFWELFLLFNGSCDDIVNYF